ncbi:hypothetical protein QBC43DRAFT_309074 [Cladorrhinum sp. PSN259]|nr:hypothetical protein QBC43DRAFT_309074 [Cladorrhinum sp. PSN259]
MRKGKRKKIQLHYFRSLYIYIYIYHYVLVVYEAPKVASEGVMMIVIKYSEMKLISSYSFSLSLLMLHKGWLYIPIISEDDTDRRMTDKIAQFSLMNGDGNGRVFL